MSAPSPIRRHRPLSPPKRLLSPLQQRSLSTQRALKPSLPFPPRPPLCVSPTLRGRLLGQSGTAASTTAGSARVGLSIQHPCLAAGSDPAPPPVLRSPSSEGRWLSRTQGFTDPRGNARRRAGAQVPRGSHLLPSGFSNPQGSVGQLCPSSHTYPLSQVQHPPPKKLQVPPVLCCPRDLPVGDQQAVTRQSCYFLF